MRKICLMTILMAFALLFVNSCNTKNGIETVPAKEFAKVIANPEVQLVDDKKKKLDWTVWEEP